MVTNDDGIDAIGIKMLAEAVSELGEVLVVAPTIQRSGESKSLTFSRPLRIARHPSWPYPAFSNDGTPADSVVLGRYLCRKEYGCEPDLIVSGINAGDNTSVHALLTSGTCAAAFEGALLGIPSIAFSMEVHSSELFFGGTQLSDYSIAAKRAIEIAGAILKEPLPEGLKFLNVNYPSELTMETPYEIVRLASLKYENEVIEAKDPRGTLIYWIWGGNLPEDRIPKNSDAYAIMHNKTIAVTSISLGFGRWANPLIEDYFTRNGLAFRKF